MVYKEYKVYKECREPKATLVYKEILEYKVFMVVDYGQKQKYQILHQILI